MRDPLEIRLGRLRLAPHETLLVKVDVDAVPVEMADHIRGVIATVLGPQQKVLIIDRKIDLTVLEPSFRERRAG